MFRRHIHGHQEATFGGWRRGFPGPWDARGGGPFGGWGRHGRGGRHGGRARRGDVRAAILALLAERPMHGYEMINELAERTDGVWRPSPGSVYPTLQLLEDEGLIVSESAGGKRLFTLTDAGRAAAAEGGDSAPWDDINEGIDPIEHKLRETVFGLMAVFKQLAFTASPAQRARALDVLNETKRKLYQILAEDE